MAELYKFFNAVEIAPGVFDREYQESDFADYFGSLLSNGLINIDVIPGMVVTVDTGTLNTIVSQGKAILKGHMYENTSPLTLAHNIPEATLNRIDRVVLRLDSRNQSRFIKLFVKEGAPAASPVAPLLQRDNFIHELSLAKILVRANTVQLLGSDLVDERLNEDLCGLATWNPKVPTDQFQKQWDEFMAGIEDSGFASAAELNEHKADYISHPANGGTTAGTATAYTCDLSANPTSLTDKMGVMITAHVDSGANPTLKWGTLVAKSIKKPNGNAAILKKDGLYTLRYNSVNDSFILQGEGGEYGNAVASQVLAPNTIGTENGLVTGTMPNNGAINQNIATQNGQSIIPAGYHNGAGKVTANIANLVADNIKSGANVGGVIGNVTPLPGPSTGHVVVLASPLYRSMYVNNFTVMKEIVCNFSGNVTVRFSLGERLNGKETWGLIRINGVDRGILRMLSTYGEYYEDFYVNAGDRVQLCLRSPTEQTIVCYILAIQFASNPLGTVTM